jgi:hypothetical protein
MTEKERVNLNICSQCDYQKVCFKLLKYLHRITGCICKQGRKKKEFRQRQAALEEIAKDQT